LKKDRLFSLFSVFVISVLFLSLFSVSALFGRSADELRLAIGIDPDTLDPIKITTTLPGNITDFVCERLVRVNKEGEVVPLLAEEWSKSADGLEWTFKLREGVTFHDGTPLDAEVVKFTFDRLMNPEIAVPQRSDLGPLEKAEVVSKYEIKLVLGKPYGPFLRSLATTLAAIVSPKAVEESDQKFANHPVGTGPYEFKNWAKGKAIVLEKNDDYWGEGPNFQSLKFNIVTEVATREMMLRSGDVDIAYMPPAPDIPSLRRDPDIEVKSIPSTRMMYVFLHTKEKPTSNKKVRQAINYAIDKEAIVEKILMDQGEPVTAPIPSSFFGYHRIGSYEYDPEKAEELLAEAGYADAEIKLKFLHPSGRYMLDKKVAQAIQSYLNDVGIKVELMTMDWPSVIKHIMIPLEEDPPQDMEFLGWGPAVLDAHFTLYSLFHSSQQPPSIANTGFYGNEKVDQLLDEALSETDTAKRKELYKQACEIIWEEAPIIFLYTQNFVLAYDSDLEGITMFPTEKFDVVDAHFVEG